MRTTKTQSGAVLVELALLLFPLLTLVFGITEFGRAVYQYNAIAKSVRDGARYLSQYAPGDATRILEAQSMVLCGRTACDGVPPLVPGMKLSYVRVRDRISDPAQYNLQSTGRGSVNLVRIEVSGFTFRSIAPAFVPDQLFGAIQATMVQVS
jgi:Flp pilus assembly protein TadG